MRRDEPEAGGGAAGADDGAGDGAGDIEVNLDRLLLERGLTLTELSHRVGISIVNLSILKNGRARAIRFSTLSRLCEVLRCQPGDLLVHRSSADVSGGRPSR